MKFCQPVTTLTVKAQVNNGSLVSNQNMCCHVILSCITSHVFLRANILIKHGSMLLRGAEFKDVPTIITPPHWETCKKEHWARSHRTWAQLQYCDVEILLLSQEVSMHEWGNRCMGNLNFLEASCFVHLLPFCFHYFPIIP